LDDTDKAYVEFRDTIESESEIVSDVLNGVEDDVNEVTEASNELAKEVVNELVPAMRKELDSTLAVTSAYAKKRD
jgi:hypothetical protein